MVEPLRVVSCFQIRNFVISNNTHPHFILWREVVSCFQIRNFVISNDLSSFKELTEEL